jgi:hypothetical protein
VGFFSIGVGNYIAAVSQIFHRKAFGVAACSGSFGPGITIALQRHAGNAYQITTTPKSLCPVGLLHFGDSIRPTNFNSILLSTNVVCWHFCWHFIVWRRGSESDASRLHKPLEINCINHHRCLGSKGVCDLSQVNSSRPFLTPFYSPPIRFAGTSAGTYLDTSRKMPVFAEGITSSANWPPPTRR